MHKLIKQYIDKLTINNINDFAEKNNCFLNKNELNLLYDCIKVHYLDILKGNDSYVIETLRSNLTEENFDKVINLYNLYKSKYKNYL